MTMRLITPNPIKFEEGWDIIHRAVLKFTESLTRDLDGFTVSEYTCIQDTVFEMCNQNPPHCYAQELYDKYRESIEEYITLNVSPALAELHDEFMLIQLLKRWENHKVMVHYMSNMFYYLDLFFVPTESLDSLIQVGFKCFRRLFCDDNVKNVLIELINRERQGEQIDRSLLRNVLNIFVETGMDFYKNYFEAPMLEDTGTYYSRKAALWIAEDSCPEYMLKAEECLRHEKEIVAHYLHVSAEQNLIKKVQNEIISRYQTQLLENENSGFHVLLRDQKKDDLSRLYRLFSRIPNGLKMVAGIFKQHVTSEGLSLVKWVEDAVNNDADTSDIAAAQGIEFVVKIIELHEHYMDYVMDSFQNNTTFGRGLKKAFKVICNKRVGGKTSAELLATFCDTALKKGSLPNIMDDKIDSILEKAVSLINIRNKYLFLVPKESLESLLQVGIKYFHRLLCDNMHFNVINVVIELINRERQGEQIDRSLLRNVLDSFVYNIGMDFYKYEFEAAMLKDTRTYYSRKAAVWIAENSCPEYMLKAEECLKHENERISHYLNLSTKPNLIGIVHSEIISRYRTQLLENENFGFRVLLRDQKKDDLSRMYRLFSGILYGLETVAGIFKHHVTSEGLIIVKWVEDAVNNDADTNDIAANFVGKIIELHDIYMDHVVDTFQNNTTFGGALKEAFQVICSKRVGKKTSAELLATFCDTALKNGSLQNIMDYEIESTLEKAVSLIEYTNDKDLFVEFYRTKLGSRLLSDKRANDNLERSILSKIKLHTYSRSTSNMEGMLKDFTLSLETQADFRTYLENSSNNHPGTQFAVTVLTNGFWPTYKTSELHLPLEMLQCIEVFKSFYSTKYNHRNLTWIYSLGNCNIIGKFDSKPIEITVTTYLGVMLLLFNESERLSYSDIKSQLNLPDEDVAKLLHAVVSENYKIILSKEPIDETIAENDVFEFNHKFTCKSRKIKILVTLENETAKKKVIEATVEEKRPYIIDAAIARIMKSRKVLTVQELMSECVKQVRLTCEPDFKLMQERIKKLISKDILEEDKENGNIIRYLA